MACCQSAKEQIKGMTMNQHYTKKIMYALCAAMTSYICAADDVVADGRKVAEALRAFGFGNDGIVNRLIDRIEHLRPVVATLRSEALAGTSLISQLEDLRSEHIRLSARRAAILRTFGISGGDESSSLSSSSSSSSVEIIPVAPLSQQVSLSSAGSSSSSSSSSSSAAVSVPTGRKNELKWLLTSNADFSSNRLRSKRAAPLISSDSDCSSSDDEYSSDETVSVNPRAKRARSTRSSSAIDSSETDEDEYSVDVAIEQEHTPTLVSAFLCSPCDRAFKSPHALRVHEGKSQHQKVIAGIPPLSSPLDDEQQSD
jgi:hypothetical protein